MHVCMYVCMMTTLSGVSVTIQLSQCTCDLLKFFLNFLVNSLSSHDVVPVDKLHHFFSIGVLELHLWVVSYNQFKRIFASHV